MRSILILKGLNQNLPQIEKFLEGRGYQITVVHRMYQAIQFIIDQRPDYALLSTDLVPAESKWLCGVLNQVTAIVLFAERASAKSLAVVRELRDFYLLEPPLTPMGFEHILRRVDRDHKKQNQEASKLDHTHVWIMSALSDLALKAVCKPKEDAAGAELASKTSRVTCLRVQNQRLAGYFLVVLGQGRPLEPSWSIKLQNRLRDYFVSFDKESEITNSEEMIIREVRFHDWTKKQADFVHQAIHEDAELALAFFKDTADLQIQPSPRRGYVQMALEHVPSDRVMDYDVYIYLPQNARFILYAGQGETLFETQKQRLLADGVNSVHIHKRSLEYVHRERMRQFVEESSVEFS